MLVQGMLEHGIEGQALRLTLDSSRNGHVNGLHGLFQNLWLLIEEQRKRHLRTGGVFWGHII